MEHCTERQFLALQRKTIRVATLMCSGDYEINSIVLPPSALIRYREMYGARVPNVGLKLEAEEVARRILRV